MNTHLAASLLLLGKLAFAIEPPLLEVLQATGVDSRGMVQASRHPRAADFESALLRGYSGRLLQVYRWEQNYLHRATGRPPAPAFLILTKQQGGFAKFGFSLDGRPQPDAAYVDLHQAKRIHGYGAMDQIFPHELAHIILIRASSAPGGGGSNQHHAIGVRTDPVQAFHEGFAEHCQVLAINDPDADPHTRDLARDAYLNRYAAPILRNYAREISAERTIPGRWRLTFFAWSNIVEGIMRYHAVRANAYAWEPEIPGRISAYNDYLLRNLLPGTPGGKPKPAAVMLSTEGVVSAFFYRWTQKPELRNTYRSAAYYQQFGASPEEVRPLENCYLKLIHAMAQGKPRTTADLIRAYKREFPDEASAVDAVVNDVLLGQPLPDSPQIWLANDGFHTGTGLIDQFRVAPLVHTFDLNAASHADLIGVPGVDAALASAILARVPYARLQDLQRVPGVTPALLARFEKMSSAMQALASEGEAGDSPGVAAILLSFAWRVLLTILAVWIACALLYWRIRKATVSRAVAAGLAAAVVGIVAGWGIDGNPLTQLLALVPLPGFRSTCGTGITAVAAVLLLCALPCASIALWRTRSTSAASRVLAAWALASLPAALLSWPW